MRFWKNFIKRKIDSALDEVEPTNKANKEKCKYQIEVSGESVDDLDGAPRAIPFTKTFYRETEIESLKLGKKEYAKGNEVEIWKLIKRW